MRSILRITNATLGLYPKSVLKYSYFGHRAKSYVALRNGQQQYEESNRTVLQSMVHYVEKTTYMEDVRMAQRHVMEIKVCF